MDAGAASTLKISRILHAGYIFDDSESKILFDPIFENPFSGNCYAFPQVEFDLNQIREVKFSAIFISHYHDDHCSFKSLALLDRATPIYIHCIHEELFDLIRELGFREVHQLKFDSCVRIGTFEITPRRPFDSDIDSMLQVRNGKLNILNVVDSVMDEETLLTLQREGPWDLILWPFQTMRETAVLTPSRTSLAGPENSSELSSEIPSDWIDDLRTLNPRYLVPSACQFLQEPWSWYNHAMFPISYKNFESVMARALPHSKIIRMNPGATFTFQTSANEMMNDAKPLLKPAAALPWVVPIGSSDVDFDYQPQLTPPTTAEIASHFPALTADETACTLNFCREQLLTRFRALDPTPYFSTPRLWRLSLFDHSGVESSFHYRISHEFIELLAATPEAIISKVENDFDLAWATEVPVAKLFAALERGETLTSMYLRVNDQKFSANIEADLKDFDVLEDPLIRVLFHGKFGAYQREQLAALGELPDRSVVPNTTKKNFF